MMEVGKERLFLFVNVTTLHKVYFASESRFVNVMDVMFTAVRIKTRSSLFVKKLKRLQYFPYGTERGNRALE